MTDGPAEYITSAAAARRVGRSARTVARWADAGRLPIAGYANGTRLFRAEDVDRIAAEEIALAEARAADLKAAS